MYQKEIIYMGLYKNGTRIGSAGFVKVESHEQGSRIYLKTQNIPHSISGRFPIRVYNGSEWKELAGITIQDGGGIWENELADRTVHAMLQVMLPGGYLVEGKSKSAAEAQQSAQTRPETIVPEEPGRSGRGVIPEKPESRSGAAKPGESERHIPDAIAEEPESRSGAAKPEEPERNSGSVIPGGTERYREAVMPGGTEARDEALRQQNAEARDEIEMPGAVQRRYETFMPQKPELHSEAAMPQKPEAHSEAAMPTEPPRRKDREQVIITKEELPRRTAQEFHATPQTASVYPLKEDKWEQILDTYEQIHPYGDERVYVKIEPKDFVILQSNYQHLVNNSFLLHGFYNYRYIILGKEQDYYLGVPGVFYEREKMVALMFGFEAFECPGGNVRAGEFGYYLRKVEL